MDSELATAIMNIPPRSPPKEQWGSGPTFFEATPKETQSLVSDLENEEALKNIPPPSAMPLQKQQYLNKRVFRISGAVKNNIPGVEHICPNSKMR